MTRSQSQVVITDSASVIAAGLAKLVIFHDINAGILLRTLVCALHQVD